MEAVISTADKRLLWIFGSIAALLIVVAAVIGPGPKEDSGIPSTYSSESGGARAAYLLLVNLGYRVQQWEDSPAALAAAPEASLLILAEPNQRPSREEREALIQFAQTGGYILFCGRTLGAFFPSAVTEPVFGSEWKEFTASLPSSVSRGAENVLMRPEAFWKDLSSTQLRLYGEQDSPAVVEWRFGAGRVLWWAGATPLTNAGITRAGNLNLFLNSVARDREIFWDEYFHGQRGSLLHYFDGTPLILGLVQITILVVAFLFTFSRRSGPVVAPATSPRLSPLEFVETMGGLYQRAGAASIPVAVSYRRLRLELTRRLGLPASSPDLVLANSAAERLGASQAVLGELLKNASEVEKPSPRRALELVQALESETARLKTFSQEKK